MELKSTQYRAEMAETFFNLLYGKIREKKFGYLWTKQDKATYPYDVSIADNRKLMAKQAIELSDKGFDVYAGINLGDEPPAENKRFTADKITMQTATITDIDVEGGDHISTDKKLYPPTFDVAKSFLPLTVSFLVDSGFGLHGYCLYSEPITITAENRDDCTMRNKNFIEVIRRNAGKYSTAVDGVGDLPRVLRVAGTYNYKCGKDNAPLCKLVEDNGICFTPAYMDERLNALTPLMETKQLRKPNTLVARADLPTTDAPEYDLFRAQRMLDDIQPTQLSYDDWLATNTSCKTIGLHYSIVDAFNRRDADRYNETENLAKWQEPVNPSFDIRTLHGIAKRFGYDEKDSQREWYKLHPNTNPNFDNPEDEAAFRARVTELAAESEFDAALMKRLEDWQKQNGKINPKLLPEIKDAAEYVEGLNADDFDVADVYDLIRNQQIALLSYYLPQHRQQFFDVLTDAVKFARKAIKELEKQKLPAESDARLKKLAKITVGEIKKAVDELKGDVKNKHRTYLIELEAKAIQEEREREIANFKPEQTKQKISDCPVDLKLPRGVYFDDKGIRRVDWDKPPNKYGGRPVINVCTTPIVPTKILREPSKNTTAYEVAIKARGFWRSVEIDGDELADSKKIIRLAKDGGALIESAQHLCKYFAQIIGLNQNVLPEIKCYNKTGWHSKDFSSFVYPADDADYIVRRAGFDFKKSLAVRGDAEKWKKAFIIACGDKSGISDSVARIFFGYGALAPLVRPLNLQNAQLLLHCKINNGKSALQKLTASFYGDPSELIKSFSATLKYRQGVATAYCDLPTFLDEPEAGANKRNEENYSQMIYDYAEGKTNQANQKNGAARESENFYGTRVITAERPLLKPSDKDGAYKRMPQITCEKLFNLDFAVYLHETTEENYGHFGKAWTEYITAHRKEIAASYRHIKELIKKRDLNVEKTVRNAIIAAAVATQYVFVMLNFKPQFDADEAEADAAAILASLPSQDEQDEATRALKDLQSHFAFKEKSFVHEGNNKNADEAYTNADTGGDEPTATFDTSGKVFKNGEVAILPTVLRNWLEKDLGYASTDAIVAEWTRRGLLRTGSGNGAGSRFRTRIKGRPTWSYRFKAGVLFDTETVFEEEK